MDAFWTYGANAICCPIISFLFNFFFPLKTFSWSIIKLFIVLSVRSYCMRLLKIHKIEHHKLLLYGLVWQHGFCDHGFFFFFKTMASITWRNFGLSENCVLVGFEDHDFDDLWAQKPRFWKTYIVRQMVVVEFL